MGSKWNWWLSAVYGTFAVEAMRRAINVHKRDSLGNVGRSGTALGYAADTVPGDNQRAAEALTRASKAILTTGKRYTIRGIDDRVSYIKKWIDKGSLDPAVREAAIALVSKKCGTRGNLRWCIDPKDYLGEIHAIYRGVQNANSEIAIRYVRDHQKVDQFTSAPALMRLRGGDCFVKGTLVLRSDHQLVHIESLRVGDKIWGRDRWTRVENVWEKGILPTYSVRLNNGSKVRLTANHKVYVGRCDRHANRTGRSAPCSCTITARRVERITVAELKKGDVLLRPDRIPFGACEMDRDRAFMEGLYLSDGWCEPEAHRFAISGKDGFRKEAQKKLVKEIAQRLGLPLYWHKRYIRITDKEWTARLSTMGTKAPNKRALSINLSEGPALGLLEGILADSTKNTSGKGRTFTTTSRTLAVQTRVLAKMAGITCGERFLPAEQHGGLGSNPIWRLQLWGKGSRVEKLLRVAEVVKDNFELPCFDVATEDHYVWLPEADVTVSNCDDGSILIGSLLMTIGYPIRLRVIQDSAADTWSHIYPMVQVPPGKGGWMPLDWSVVPFKQPGWEVPKSMIVKYRDYNV